MPCWQDTNNDSVPSTVIFQYNKNMIHNLSNHNLTEEELSVLVKGLPFAPTLPKLSNKKQILKQV